MKRFWLVSIGLLSAVTANASPARDALEAVAKCAEIPATAERLQCFDAAAASAKSVLAAANKPAEPEAESEGGLLSWFGFAPEEKPVTKPEDFGVTPKTEDRPGAPKEITEISAVVVEYAKNAHGKSLFILDNGQVWKQIDGDTSELYYREADGPMKVKIEKAFLGSFSLYVEGKSGKLKVRRVK